MNGEHDEYEFGPIEYFIHSCVCWFYLSSSSGIEKHQWKTVIFFVFSVVIVVVVVFFMDSVENWSISECCSVFQLLGNSIRFKPNRKLGWSHFIPHNKKNHTITQ